MAYPDIEKLLVAFYRAETGYRAATELPATLEQAVPVIQVARVPSGAGYRLDRPLVDVSVWTLKAQRALCSQIAQQVVDLTTWTLIGQRRPEGVVTAASVDVAPYWLSDPNPNLCRYLATYRLSAHT
ncbi:hypothetical protein GCM10023085_45420 [Actinomadura viridis]|uniref:Tail terminator n=1 Tax=Actinomadura viridis TaxID=58110 RepID=A0A931DIC9_9ACTN|nr:hypothetical protein [Actinomadura viridis]MBG6089902.1 hypothetical protein [Actinomadura viridis]